MNHHTPKLIATAGVVGELVAWMQSQPVLGAVSLLGTVISAVSAWYWSEKGRKRRDRREEHMEHAFETVVATFAHHIAAEVKAGKPDPFPEITKMLLEMGRSDDPK